jgi:hypothetical protein
MARVPAQLVQCVQGMGVYVPPRALAHLGSFHGLGFIPVSELSCLLPQTLHPL